MFDDYTRSLLEQLPGFDGLSRESAARALSTAYLAIVKYRLSPVEARADDDLDDVVPRHLVVPGVDR